MIIIDSAKIDRNNRLANIAKLESIAIDLAILGLNYDHVLIEANNLTYDYLDDLRIGAKAPLELRQRLNQPKALNGEEKKVYKELTSPTRLIYEGVMTGDVFYIKEFENHTTKKMQSRVVAALTSYNKMNGTNHSYETHMNKNELRLKRVG